MCKVNEDRGAKDGQPDEKRGLMMKRIISLVSVAVLIIWTPAIAGEPYAPKVDVPKNVGPESQMSAMIINAAQVPDKSAVEIPPYPGARVFQTRQAGEMTANDKKIKTLPYIKLLSTDPQDKIVAWYKKQLKGYTAEDVFGTGWMLWKQKGKFNALDIRDTMTHQNVYISKAIAAFGYDKDMKGTKSVIEITYEPK